MDPRFVNIDVACPQTIEYNIPLDHTRENTLVDN